MNAVLIGLGFIAALFDLQLKLSQPRNRGGLGKQLAWLFRGAFAGHDILPASLCYISPWLFVQLMMRDMMLFSIAQAANLFFLILYLAELGFRCGMAGTVARMVCIFWVLEF